MKKLNKHKNKHRNIVIGLLVFVIIITSKFPYLHIKRKVLNKNVKKRIEKQINIRKNNTINKVQIDNNKLMANEITNEEINTKIKEPEWINIEISYYSNIVSNCGKCDSISANGTNLNNYVYSRGGNQFDDYYVPIACPKSIPFNTKLFISGIGNCICLDRGFSIQWKDNNTMKIDVYIPNITDEELNKLGLKQSKGYIIKN